MGRVAFAFVAMGVLAGAASAAPTRKVKVETEPPGATVYLDNKENGPVCTPTPCQFDAPVGDTPIIIEIEGHKPEITLLSVPARGRLSPFPFKLEPAIATIVIDGPKGASIEIGEIDHGKAPTRIEVPAGPHIIKMTLDGKDLEPQAVDLAAGAEVTITGSAPTEVGANDAGDDDTIIIDDGTTGGVAVGGRKGPAKPRGRVLAISLAMDIGFRDFTYEAPMTDNLPTETERGQVLVGPYVELWPAAAAGLGRLRGLSLMGRFGYGVNSQIVREPDGSPTDARTYWRAFEVSLRQRWTIGSAGTFEVGGGFVRDQYQFEGEASDIERVPDADYQSVRVGVRGSIFAEPFEPYLAVESRLVLSGGTLEERFDDGAEATGVRVGAGVAAQLGPITARVEGSWTRYGWTFKNDSAMDEFVAAGGVDSIKTITILLGWSP